MNVNRRGFLGLAACAGAFGLSGCKGFPAIVSRKSPNGVLRFGAIGCGSQGQSDISRFKTHKRIEMAAFCDVDRAILDTKIAKDFPKAALYQDWRAMLDREDLDAVLVEWDEASRKWKQNDVGDFVTAVPPNDNAFFMTWEQNARLFAYPMADGPMPEHFEPHEAPVKNLLNGAGGNPCALFTKDKSVKRGSVSEYPFVVTTYSVVEHWQSGTQTRTIPWLNELIPCNFIELSEELAQEKGIKNGDTVRVWNNRGDVKVAAMVTKRMKPMIIDGKVTHVVGMPHHFSWAGPFATGDNVNDLTPNVGDPNSWIPEYKAFLVNLEKAA